MQPRRSRSGARAAAAFEPVNGHALIRLAAVQNNDMELLSNALPVASEGSAAKVSHTLYGSGPRSPLRTYEVIPPERSTGD
jgi:hypothetical protein